MFSKKFSIIFIFFVFFFSILGRNNAKASGKIINLNGQDFGNFDVLNVKFNKQDGESESKKIVVININNLNLTVDSTRGEVWIYLKSLTNNANNYEIPKISVDPSSEKIHTLDTKTLSSFDILNITLSPDVTSLESKKKINVLIDDIVVALDTRNYVALALKSAKTTKSTINFNNNVNINGNSIFLNSDDNNVFFSTNDINGIEINFHWDRAAFSTFIGGIDGDFDRGEFDKDMNELREDMKTMREDMRRDEFFDREAFNEDMNEMQKNMKEMRENLRESMQSRREELKNNMDQMREDMKKMRVNMRESFH
ncbi:uncharacterized protein LOC141525564 [Cotesia typhae]|uniref:uncharacterized protein LOC141525564 n=1 Tax=Cotesia typhae TaxID=2053667 RepID=UPI003D68F76E